MIWRATTPAAIFNNRFDQLSRPVDKPAVVAVLPGGRAYERATKMFLESVQNRTVRSQIIDVFSDSLKITWYVTIGFAGLDFHASHCIERSPVEKGAEMDFRMAGKPTRSDGPPVKMCTQPDA